MTKGHTEAGGSETEFSASGSANGSHSQGCSGHRTEPDGRAGGKGGGPRSGAVHKG